MTGNADLQLLTGILCIAGGLAVVIGVFWGMASLIKKRQASDSRCYPNQDESIPWGV